MKKYHYIIMDKIIFPILFVILIFGGLFLSDTKVFAAEASVGNWADFKTAYEDQTVTKITLTNDITYTGGAITLKYRTADLVIDGTKSGTVAADFNNYKLDLGYTSLMIGQPTSGSTATMSIQNISLANYGDIGTGNRAGIIETYNAYGAANARQYGKYWTFNLENVYVPDVNSTTGAARLLRTPRAQINVSGNNKLYTRAENFYTGGMNFAENTKYYGEITQANYSVIWFNSQVGDTDTGTGDFIVQNNADVKLRNVRNTANTGYPAIYMYYKSIQIGENAKFTASVPGAAVQFSGDGQTFTAKKGAVVTLTSLASFPSIQDSVTNFVGSGANATKPAMDWSGAYARNMRMTFDAGSSLFVIGKTSAYNTAMINLGSYNTALQTNNQITLNSPEQFDIRNNSTGTLYDAVQIGQYGSNSFTVNDSNLSFWKRGSSFSSGADLIYDDVSSLSLTSKNVWSGSDSAAVSALNAQKSTTQSNISRINGLNTKPTLEWEYNITDADKTLSKFARVIIGSVPDDTGLDANGDLHFLTQYAGAGLPVSLTNSENATVASLATDSSGYVSTTLDDFYSSGTTLSAIATRGKLVSDASVSDAVFKITPPNPAKLDSGKIYDTDTSLIGSGAEVGSTVFVKVNGKQLDKTVTVGSDGTFNFPLDTKLTVNDVVMIYLQDNAGLAPTKLQHLPAPTTNNSTGNINPDGTLTYSDATFPAASKYIVEQGLSTLTIQFENENGQIMDGYTLTAGNAETNSISTPIYIGDTIDLTSSTFKTLQDQITSLESAGYEIVSRPDNENALPITEAEQTVTYQVRGLLSLQSAPATVDFGSITFTGKKQEVTDPTIDKDLIIMDTRATKENGWTLYASLSSSMKNSTTGSVMNDALRYVNNSGNEITLNEGNQPIVSNSDGGTENISSSWGAGTTKTGLKLVADPSKTTVSSVGSYSGTVTWTIMAGQP